MRFLSYQVCGRVCQDGKVPVWGPLSLEASWAVGSGQRGGADPGRDSEAERSLCVCMCVCVFQN